MLLGVLAVGVGLAIARAREQDARMRADLVRQASHIAWALETEVIESLAGDIADEQDARYLRIKQQLTTARALYPEVRFIYLTRLLPDGRIIFLADSEDPASPDYSHPGQVYEEATDELRLIFSRPRAITEGPVRDRWGVWVSALIPIQDPASGAVLAVLGIDVDAATWANHIAFAAIIPLGFMIALMGLWIVLRPRMHLRGVPPQRSRPYLAVETLRALGAGLILTAFAVVHVQDSEKQRHRADFARKAQLQSGMMQDLIERVGHRYLSSIVHFVASRERITEEEFRGFVAYLHNRPYVLYWGWAPLVRGGARPDSTAPAPEAGSRGGGIGEREADGARPDAESRDEYFPLLFAESARYDGSELGFDHASDSRRLDAIRRAIETGLPEATEPLVLPHGDPDDPVIMVYHRVMDMKTGAFRGLAVAALRLKDMLVPLLNRETIPEDALAHMALCLPETTGELVVLASSPGGPRIHERTAAPDWNRTWLVAPAFAFGRVFAIASIPADPALWYPAAAMRKTAGVGFLLTGLLTALVATLTGRRAELERLVNERTAELRASESSYHGLFNSIRQAIYIQDQEGRFLDVNDGAVAMYGYSREEFLGRTPDFLSPPGRNDMAHIQSRLRRAWNGEPQVFEFWGRRKNGEIFPKTVSLYKGCYFGKDVLIAVASDISERKQAEEQQAKLQAQLQQAQKLESIGRLAGGVAHDFNNMLQAILGNAMLAIEETRESKVLEYLAEIKRSAERSADLTRQLLAFASRQPIHPKVIDLNQAIEGTLKMLRRLIGEDIQLRWNPDRAVGPVWVDPIQIDQILANLAVNARDAIDGVGTITIDTWTLAPATMDSARATRIARRASFRASE